MRTLDGHIVGCGVLRGQRSIDCSDDIATGALMDLQDFVTQLERMLRIGITIVAAYLVALWIASVWWTFRDIRGRTTDIFLQVAATLLVAVFAFPGLLIYVILRPPKTLAQLYEDSLEE